jgi:hypothetical protein
MNDGDAMKARAETANVPRIVQGSDGAQWAVAVLRDPMRTLPSGAGYLIVRHFTDRIELAALEALEARPVAEILEALRLEGIFGVVVRDSYVYVDEMISLERLPAAVKLFAELSRALEANR